MDLGDVMDQVAERIRVISSLSGRTFAFPPKTLTPPAAIVSYPEDYVFDATYGRGADRLTLPLLVVVGDVSDRASRDQLAAYCDGAGDQSIKQVVESGSYMAFDDATVASIEFDVVTVGGTNYMSALFTINIIGAGS